MQEHILRLTYEIYELSYLIFYLTLLFFKLFNINNSFKIKFVVYLR